MAKWRSLRIRLQLTAGRLAWWPSRDSLSSLMRDVILADWLAFRNADRLYIKCYRRLRAKCRGLPSHIRGALRASGKWLPEDAEYRGYSVLLGKRVEPTNARFVTLLRASELYEMLFDKGPSPYDLSDGTIGLRAAAVAAKITDIAAGRIRAEDAFHPFLPGKHGFVWIAPADDGQSKQQGMTPHDMCLQVGVPVDRSAGPVDVLVAVTLDYDLAVGKAHLHVPTVFESRGCEWFLPGIASEPRSGLTVDLRNDDNPCDGVREWVIRHRIDMTSLRFELLGPISPRRLRSMDTDRARKHAGILKARVRQCLEQEA